MAKHLMIGRLPATRAKQARVEAVVVVAVPHAVTMKRTVGEGVVEDVVVTACLMVSTLRTRIVVANNVVTNVVAEAAVGALPTTTTSSVIASEVVVVNVVAAMAVVVEMVSEEDTSNVSISTRRDKTEPPTTMTLPICLRLRNIKKLRQLKIWHMTVLIIWVAARITRDRARGLTRTWELQASTSIMMITVKYKGRRRSNS